MKMVQKPIPSPLHYGIDPLTGFLPSDPPLQYLSCLYYSPWEQTLTEIPVVRVAGSFRAPVKSMPVLKEEFVPQDHYPRQ